MNPKQNVCSAPLTYESGFEMKPESDVKQIVPLCTNELTIDELMKYLKEKRRILDGKRHKD